MATVTQVLSTFDNGDVVFEAIITTADGTTGNVTGFRATAAAGATGAAYGEVFLPDGTRKQTQTCLVGSDTTVSVPTTALFRLPVTFSALKQRWVGIRGNFLGPSHPAVAGAALASSAPRRVTYE